MKNVITFCQVQTLALLVVAPVAACFVPFDARLWGIVAGVGSAAFILVKHLERNTDPATQA
jgi:hypothetical protein